MSDGTKIEWTDATANYVNGCSVISAGCTNCYAMRLAGTRLQNHPTRQGLTQPSKAGPVWTGEVRRNEAVLRQVLGWKRPRRVFWNAHGDLFHKNVPDEWIDAQFAVMALTPQHQHQVLTKRPERMREYLMSKDVETPVEVRWASAFVDLRYSDELVRVPSSPLPNVWLGTSVEDQRAADERIPHLLATPAALRFLSCEPLLGPVDIRWTEVCVPSIDWVIAGGESGPGARPMHPDWVRSLRDQCATAGVPFFMKQWGEWATICYGKAGDTGKFVAADDDDELPLAMVKIGKARAGRLLDGVEHNGMPA